MNKIELTEKRADLIKEISNIDAQLEQIKQLEKPYVACISSYSGGGQAAFKTEKQEKIKLNEYANKDYFRNGLSYGAYLYKHNQDGSKTLLENRPINKSDFYPPMFKGIKNA